MFINLNDREAELLTLALRYWRSQRLNGTMRRRDPRVGPDAIDLLLAKLGPGLTSSPKSPLDPDDPFDELLSR